MWGARRNCGKWSEMSAVKFADTISWDVWLEKKLSMTVYEWEVILVVLVIPVEVRTYWMAGNQEIHLLLYASHILITQQISKKESSFLIFC